MVAKKKAELIRRLGNIVDNTPLTVLTVKQIKAQARMQNSIAKGTIKTKEQLFARLRRAKLL